MINLHQVYNDAPLGQKHAMVREVFEDSLTYFKGTFRTPSINPGLCCNLLLLKKIGLLGIEQPYEFEKSFSLCGERGIRTPGPVTVNSFQDCRIRPLCQLSAAKVGIWNKSANLFPSNILINILSLANHLVTMNKKMKKRQYTTDLSH